MNYINIDLINRKFILEKGISKSTLEKVYKTYFVKKYDNIDKIVQKLIEEHPLTLILFNSSRNNLSESIIHINRITKLEEGMCINLPYAVLKRKEENVIKDSCWKEAVNNDFDNIIEIAHKVEEMRRKCG